MANIIADIVRSQSNLKKTQSLLRDGLPFTISMKSINKELIRERSLDKERVAKFNKDVKAWTRRTTSKLKASVRSLVQKDISLSDSLTPAYYHYENNKKSEITRIGFGVEREGIYIQKGAGRGHGGYVGSQWTDLYGKLKKTNPKSKGLMDTGNRRSINWLNSVMEKEIEELADIVAEYSADIIVDATKFNI